MSAIIRNQWGASLFAGHLFVFLGRRRDRCKILFWDRGGMVLCYKIAMHQKGCPISARFLPTTTLCFVTSELEWQAPF